MASLTLYHHPLMTGLFDVDAEILLAVGVTFFFAAFVKGTTGLGFSTTCLPFLVLILGIKETLAVLIVPALASNVLVMVDAGHFRSTVARFWPLYISIVPGIAIGLMLLDWSDPLIAAAVLGFVLLIYCAIALARPGLQLAQHLRKPLASPVGLATGLINGLTGCQVMPVLPFLLSLQLDANRLVQALNCSGSLSSVVMAAGLSKLGIMTWQTALLSAAGTIPVYLGVQVGNHVRRLLSPEVFRTAVLLMLILLGLSLIVRPILLG